MAEVTSVGIITKQEYRYNGALSGYTECVGNILGDVESEEDAEPVAQG